ncbi:MAG: YidC/Oxa1 family membrane protein insertase, partial [Ruthenibacterium sp.]
MSFLSDNFISRFFISVIEALFNLSGDYVVAVLLFTVLVKIVLLPLDIKAKSATQRMQAIAPKTAALRERYKNNPEKLNAATRELYKKENVSTMQGCLPT